MVARARHVAMVPAALFALAVALLVGPARVHAADDRRVPALTARTVAGAEPVPAVAISREHRAPGSASAWPADGPALPGGRPVLAAPVPTVGPMPTVAPPPSAPVARPSRSRAPPPALR